jgi:hypothetical protein
LVALHCESQKALHLIAFWRASKRWRSWISPDSTSKTTKVPIDGCLAHHGWMEIMGDEDILSPPASLREPHHLVWDERLTEKDKALVSQLNAALDRLNQRRALEIKVSGPFARSKIAWKLAIHQHGLLHRLVALMDGTSVAWNNRSTLSAILSARALMETLAVMAVFAGRAEGSFAAKDLGALDALAEQGAFSSRDPEWLKEAPETKAINVLTYIDEFDKRASGFRGHYDILSERCHPNSLGHNFMFSKLDRSDGSVRFFDEREPERNGQMILAALAVFPLVESIMNRLDDLIPKISDLHHRIAPVGGAAPPAEPPSEGSSP